MINIAIVEDHTLFREGLISLLSKIEDFKIVAEYSNGKEFINNLFSTDIDLVLMDIEMPVMNGIEACCEAKIKKPLLQVIALSMYRDQKYYYEMIKAGASGFILKDATTTELEKAIRDVNAGLAFFTPQQLQQIILNIPNAEKSKNTITKLNLSPRETDVLNLICMGYSNVEIAQRLFISIKTVESHKTRLLKKTNSKNSVNLIFFAVKNELIKA